MTNARPASRVESANDAECECPIQRDIVEGVVLRSVARQQALPLESQLRIRDPHSSDLI